MITTPAIGVGVLVQDQDRVLLVQRSNPPRQGRWTVPGGKLRLGETLQQAAEREVLEETGLIIRAGDVVHVFEHLEPEGDGWRFHYVVIDLLGTVTGGVLNRGSDAAAVRWFSPADLGDPAVDSQTLLLIQKYQSL